MSRTTASTSFVSKILLFIIYVEHGIMRNIRCQIGLGILKWRTQICKVSSGVGGYSKTSVPATDCHRSVSDAANPVRRDGNSST